MALFVLTWDLLRRGDRLVSLDRHHSSQAVLLACFSPGATYITSRSSQKTIPLECGSTAPPSSQAAGREILWREEMLAPLIVLLVPSISVYATLPLTYGTPSTLSTVASSPSSTSFPVSDTPLVVHLADGTLHHLIPTDTLTDSSPPSPSSTPPIPIPPPHLRYRSPAPSSDSDLDSPRPASTTAVDSDSDYDSDPNDLHATGTIAVSRVINPAHVFFLQTTINTPLFRGSERTAYVARSQYPIVPGHVISVFPL
ncbi:hypothetical protein GSI_05639 [Ganoderma sinense ZZ0214-1]|uniref:Uncharacterized protein n=1 Tax=Ganoderma sinense ZZ0214-1 TaxID=1077348 RepID=A0A2G8SF62_9APHY|nr:hypothetical protein GSI_05639 [Ganoderma sinense ZZ0214-1]